MARLFASASSQRLQAAAAAVTAYPCTMSCWMQPTTSTATMTALSVGSSTVARYLALGIVTANTGFFECASTATADALGPAGTIADGAWGHLAGVATSATARICYVNGVAGTTDATNLVFPASVDRTNIGCLLSTNVAASFLNGAVAEAAMWNVTLTAAEITMLALGIRPFKIRPASLVFYAPLLSGASPEQELRAASALVLSGTPTQVGHARITHGTGQRWIPKTQAVAAARVSLVMAPRIAAV